jgi:hypothetical protein
MSLRLRPWTVKRETAIAFNLATHRKLPKIQGAMWCVSIRSEGEIVGVALVGWPSQEQTSDEIDHLRVLRCTVKEGHKNGCSMLYGACWRAARAMGVESMDTFTLLDEPGTSLRAAGWIEDGTTAGGEHSRKSRPRAPAVDARPKRRWWAPGSAKAPACGAKGA